MRMRLGSVILGICLFANLIEITPLFFLLHSPNPKTCCGRPVCLCTHPKGAPCPFKKAGIDAEASHTHRFCPLKNRPGFDKRAQGNAYVPQAERGPVTGRFFKRAPCHSDEPKSSLPSYAKEFYLNPPSGVAIPEKPDFFSIPSFHVPAFIFDHRLDKPPRLLPHTASFSF